MGEPLFWLGLSIVLVAVCLAAVLMAALPALQELARAARSAEKLFDTLHRELPPTLEAIRMTGQEITNLTDELETGVEHASHVVQQVDQNLTQARQQMRQAQLASRSMTAGVQAAVRAFLRSAPATRLQSPSPLQPLIPTSTDIKTSRSIPEQSNALESTPPISATSDDSQS